MTDSDLQDTWRRTRSRLSRAFSLLVADDKAGPIRAKYEGFLDHNELELALHMLQDAAEHSLQPPEFWEQMWWAADNMGLSRRAKHFQCCQAASTNGFLRVRLTLNTPDAGGPTKPHWTGARMPWEIGNLTESGELMLNDAMLIVEHVPEVRPGDTVTAQLVPLWPEYWENLQAGARIRIRLGAREYGQAEVLEPLARWPQGSPAR
jgi:hypothetical protein